MGLGVELLSLFDEFVFLNLVWSGSGSSGQLLGFRIFFSLAGTMKGERLAGEQSAAVPLDRRFNQRGRLGEARWAYRCGWLRGGPRGIVHRRAAVL